MSIIYKLYVRYKYFFTVGLWRNLKASARHGALVDIYNERDATRHFLHLCYKLFPAVDKKHYLIFS